jgi:hypothetical protein
MFTKYSVHIRFTLLRMFFVVFIFKVTKISLANISDLLFMTYKNGKNMRPYSALWRPDRLISEVLYSATSHLSSNMIKTHMRFPYSEDLQNILPIRSRDSRYFEDV